MLLPSGLNVSRRRPAYFGALAASGTDESLVTVEETPDAPAQASAGAPEAAQEPPAAAAEPEAPEEAAEDAQGTSDEGNAGEPDDEERQNEDMGLDVNLDEDDGVQVIDD